MITIPIAATELEILTIVESVVDLLAAEKYQAVYSEVGYAVAFGRNGEECIRNEIENYKSKQYFSGEEKPKVTNFRFAKDGNPTPAKQVTFYKANELGLSGAVDYDLPINGKWSDLSASFVFGKINQEAKEYVLSLNQLTRHGVKMPNKSLQHRSASLHWTVFKSRLCGFAAQKYSTKPQLKNCR